MQYIKRRQGSWWLLLGCLLCLASSINAQNIQSRVVSVNVTRQPLGQVLNLISTQAHFVFSYNSNLVPADSLVTLDAPRKTVKQVLDLLFQGNLLYKESGNYLILQRPPAGQVFTISGYVIDQQSGHRLPNVSVYEKEQLVSTLTNEQGYFRIRIRTRDKPPMPVISISKELYLDTTIIASPAMAQDFTVSIRPAPMITLKPVDVTNDVEKTWMAHFFLSSRARMQSLNLKFLMDKPYQYSLVPGLGTHGHLSSQVVNRFSFNLIGGYSAGLNGLEFATVFNIDKGDVRDVQIAGVFNAVGGRVKGLQVAGVFNHVFDTTRAVQIAGVSNVVRSEASGLQLAGITNTDIGNFSGTQVNGVGAFNRKNFYGASVSGIMNLTLGWASGMQAAGIMNIVKDSTHGVQIAGIFNQTRKTMDGVQIAGIYNYARKAKGVQVSVVNVADTLDGVSIGVVNYVRTGYHKLSVYSTELMPLNVAFQSGARHIYTVVSGGVDFAHHRAFYNGFGMGYVFNLKHGMVLPVQLTNEIYHLGKDNEGQPETDKQNAALLRLEPSLQWQVTRKFGLFIGPSYSFCYRALQGAAGYKSLPVSFATHYTDKTSGWFGFHAGICIF